MRRRQRLRGQRRRLLLPSDNRILANPALEMCSGGRKRQDNGILSAMEGLGVGIVSGILLLKTVFASHIVLSLGGPHNAHAAAQSAVVHAAAQTPLVRLWVVDLDGFQIGGPIKTAHRIQLSIHDGQANPTATRGHGHDGAPGVGQWIVALGGRELHAIVPSADGVNVVVEDSAAQVLASRGHWTDGHPFVVSIIIKSRHFKSILGVSLSAINHSVAALKKKPGQQELYLEHLFLKRSGPSARIYIL